jgi:hypothetical protein
MSLKRDIKIKKEEIAYFLNTRPVKISNMKIKI